VTRELEVTIDQLIRMGSDVTLMLVPSHIGLQGNEMTDRLEKPTCIKLVVCFNVSMTLSYPPGKNIGIP